MKLDMCVKPEKRYLLGVSGGCDSMALLSLCLKEKMNVLVAMVNYRVRESADMEEQMVVQYCNNHNVQVFVCHPEKKQSGNFEAWAREVRYQFYRQIYSQYDCEALLLGHQKDDCIENYLMSMQRHSRGKRYGIEKQCFHHEMNIIRPLLPYRKKELRTYCQLNHVPFHDDESNFNDDYSRNKIRHSMVEPADDNQIEIWMQEIEEKNHQLQLQEQYFAENYGEMIELEKFRKETPQSRVNLIRWYLYHFSDTNYSSDHIAQIHHVLMNCEKAKIKLQVGLLIVEYGYFYLFQPKEQYEYIMKDLQYIETPYFRLTDSGKVIEGVTVSEKDFPVRIRCYRSDDSIEMRFGHKKVSRYMIDRKIFYKDRYYWPVIENKNGEIIFVYGVGCDVSHFSTQQNLFMIK